MPTGPGGITDPPTAQALPVYLRTITVLKIWTTSSLRYPRTSMPSNSPSWWIGIRAGWRRSCSRRRGKRETTGLLRQCVVCALPWTLLRVIIRASEPVCQYRHPISWLCGLCRPEQSPFDRPAPIPRIFLVSGMRGAQEASRQKVICITYARRRILISLELIIAPHSHGFIPNPHHCLRQGRRRFCF